MNKLAISLASVAMVLVLSGQGCAQNTADETVVDSPSTPVEMMEEEKEVDNMEEVDVTEKEGEAMMKKDGGAMMKDGGAMEQGEAVMKKETSESAPATDEELEPQAAASAVKSFTMTAKQWAFEPSKITVNKGDTVKLAVKSIDVTHGFGLSAFGINERLNPGETVNIEFVADKTGTFSFFCSVSCGSGHGGMRGTLIVN